MARTPYWRDTLIDKATASSAQSVTSLNGDLTPIDTRGATVIRVIMRLSVIPTALGGAVSGQIMTYGIGVVAQDAFAASAVPDPNVDADRPARGWLMRDRCLIIDVAGDPLAPVDCHGDFRGKRKLDNGELVLIVNNDNDQGAGTSITMIGLVRVLYLMG